MILYDKVFNNYGGGYNQCCLTFILVISEILIASQSIFQNTPSFFSLLPNSPDTIAMSISLKSMQ